MTSSSISSTFGENFFLRYLELKRIATPLHRNTDDKGRTLRTSDSGERLVLEPVGGRQK